MKRTWMVALIVVLAGLGWSGTARTAYAGGPTSVLAVDPDTGMATGLYHTDPAYDRLVAAVDAYGTPAGPTERPAAITEGTSPTLHLTWLIHDQQIWRFDEVYLVGDEVWVHTMTDGDGDEIDPFAEPGVWARPASPEALRTFVQSLDHPAATSADPPVTQAVAAPAGGSSVGLVAGVGVAGVVIGAAATLLWRRRPHGERIILEG